MVRSHLKPKIPLKYHVLNVILSVFLSIFLSVILSVILSIILNVFLIAKINETWLEVIQYWFLALSPQEKFSGWVVVVTDQI